MGTPQSTLIHDEESRAELPQVKQSKNLETFRKLMLHTRAKLARTESILYIKLDQGMELPPLLRDQAVGFWKTDEETVTKLRKHGYDINKAQLQAMKLVATKQKAKNLQGPSLSSSNVANLAESINGQCERLSPMTDSPQFLAMQETMNQVSTSKCCELSGCDRTVEFDFDYCSHQHGKKALLQESCGELSEGQLVVIEEGLTLDSLPEDPEEMMNMVIKMLLWVSANFICELSGCDRTVEFDFDYCSHYHGRKALFQESCGQLSEGQLVVIEEGLTLDSLPEDPEESMNMVIEMLLRVSANPHLI